jgi:hypothetical protein
LLTENLFHALQNLRDSTFVIPKVFWIDQISINQNDDQERGHQVNMMADIYRNSWQVISYLGPSKQSDAEGLELLEHIHQQYHPLYNGPELHEHWTQCTTLWRDPERIPEHWRFNGAAPKSASLSAIDIIKGPWMRRLWMAQETCINRKSEVQMLRGERLLSWSMVAGPIMLSSMNVLPSWSLGREIEIVLLCWMLRSSHRGTMHWDLLELMGGLVHVLECKDPRDQVFALLGLATDAEELGTEADYTRSFTEVITHLAMQSLSRQGLQALKWCQGRTFDGSLSAPSWVPRWETSQNSTVPQQKVCDDLEV